MFGPFLRSPLSPLARLTSRRPDRSDIILLLVCAGSAIFARENSARQQTATSRARKSSTSFLSLALPFPLSSPSKSVESLSPQIDLGINKGPITSVRRLPLLCCDHYRSRQSGQAGAFFKATSELSARRMPASAPSCGLPEPAESIRARTTVALCQAR